MSLPTPFTVFGALGGDVQAALTCLVHSSDGLPVVRDGKARSSTPYPKSTDLERALKPSFERAGFPHHHDLDHPMTGDRFEYDFCDKPPQVPTYVFPKNIHKRAFTSLVADQATCYQDYSLAHAAVVGAEVAVVAEVGAEVGAAATTAGPACGVAAHHAVGGLDAGDAVAARAGRAPGGRW